MCKFKVGDYVRYIGEGLPEIQIGHVGKVSAVMGDYITLDNAKYKTLCFLKENFELVEDRTNWHPHADVIIAWAKGEKIQYQDRGSITWWDWDATFSPGFSKALGWRIKPDNSEEIDRIKQEIQTHGKAIDELQAKLKELGA